MMFWTVVVIPSPVVTEAPRAFLFLDSRATTLRVSSRAPATRSRNREVSPKIRSRSTFYCLYLDTSHAMPVRSTSARRGLRPN